MKRITGVIGTLGDLNITQIPLKDHQVTHTPKNFVCCIPNAVSQTKWFMNPRGMEQHKTN